MANAVSVLLIIVKVGKFRDASFQKQLRKPMIGLLKIFAKIIEIMGKYVEQLPVNYWIFHALSPCIYSS